MGLDAPMTVIAGALTADGVLLAADCRLSWRRGTVMAVADDAQKIIPLGSQTVLGFSGDVQTVAALMEQLFAPQQLERRRFDGVSVKRWLPRFLRATYVALARTQAMRDCTFVVASTVPKRKHEIHTRELVRFMSTMARLKQNNYLAVRMWMTGAVNNLISVPGSSFGLLYQLDSPTFKVQDVSPLNCIAAGSGAEPVLRSLQTYSPLLFCGRPGFSIGWFMEAIAAAFATMDINSVGGLFVTVAMSGGEVRVLTEVDPVFRTRGLGGIAGLLLLGGSRNHGNTDAKES